ncbi:MAG: hypothetical protein ACOX4O_10810, partial [Eubacteriales bacterium]
SLENTGYWDYIPEELDCGRWVSDDGRIIEDGDDVFMSEQLKLNEPRIMAPLGFGGYNLNIRIESDDLIQVSSKVQGDDDIILVHSPSSPDKVIMSDWSVSNDFTTLGSFTLNVFPVGKKIPEETRQGKLIQYTTLTDREYYIDIKTFTPDLRPKVTAQLKLTVLKDDYYPWQEPKENHFYGAGEEQSRFVQIELVKYGFSDTALLDEFERYDDLYG